MYYNRPNTAVGPPVNYDRSSTPNRGVRKINKSTKNNNNSTTTSRRVVSTFSPNSTFANYVQARQANIATQQRQHLPNNPFNQGYPNLINSGLVSKSQPIVPKPANPTIPHKYGSLYSVRNSVSSSKASISNSGFRSNSSFASNLPEIDVSGQSTSLNIDLLTRKLNKLANQQQILEKVRHNNHIRKNSSVENNNISRPISQASQNHPLPPIKVDENVPISPYPTEFKLESPKTDENEVSKLSREDFVKEMIKRVLKKASRSDFYSENELLDEDEDEPEPDNHFINKLRPATSDNRGISPTTALSMYSSEQNPEIPIEVVDPNGSTKKFYCSFQLLTSGMPYFRKVFGKVDNSKFHKKDVDISVQCDISVFDILLEYVQNSDYLILENKRVDHKTLIGLLIASDHLGMTGFFEIALEYFSKNLGNIVKKVSNLHHITDSIFVRLVKLKKNSVLECFDGLPASKTQQRIFRLLCQNLVENDSEGLFRCKNCGKLLLSRIKNYEICSKQNISFFGEVIKKHEIDESFDLNQHLKEKFNSNLFNKDWKKLYWYLWSILKTLESTNCVRCNKIVQIISMNTCLNHSSKISYPTIHQGDKMFESRVGIYACCGQKETRFDIKLAQSGCMKTDHFFDRDFLSEEEQKIFDIFQHKRQDLVLREDLEKTVDRMSLLEVDNQEFLQELANGRANKVYSSDTETATTGNNKKVRKKTIFEKYILFLLFCFIESTGPSGLIISVKVNKKKPPKRQVKNLKSNKNEHQWTVSRSLRWNQDSIRNADVKRFEELMKTQKEGSDYEVVPAAGVYQNLENDKILSTVKLKSKR